MPKRKADQSIDEWIKEGIAASEANRMLAEANNNQEAIPTVPTAEGTQQAEATDRRTECAHNVATPAHVAAATTEVATVSVAPVQADVAVAVGGPTGEVAVSQEEVAEWFWVLLAQSGYERW